MTKASHSTRCDNTQSSRGHCSINAAPASEYDAASDVVDVPVNRLSLVYVYTPSLIRPSRNQQQDLVSTELTMSYCVQVSQLQNPSRQHHWRSTPQTQPIQSPLPIVQRNIASFAMRSDERRLGIDSAHSGWQRSALKPRSISISNVHNFFFFSPTVCVWLERVDQLLSRHCSAGWYDDHDFASAIARLD